MKKQAKVTSKGQITIPRECGTGSGCGPETDCNLRKMERVCA